MHTSLAAAAAILAVAFAAVPAQAADVVALRCDFAVGSCIASGTASGVVTVSMGGTVNEPVGITCLVATSGTFTGTFSGAIDTSFTMLVSGRTATLTLPRGGGSGVTAATTCPLKQGVWEIALAMA